jgi:long-chain acyl-CoA synthetase
MFLDQLEQKIESWRSDQSPFIKIPLAQESLSRSQAYLSIEQLKALVCPRDHSTAPTVGLSFEDPKNWILAIVAAQLGKCIAVPIPSEFTAEQIASFVLGLHVILTDSETAALRFAGLVNGRVHKESIPNTDTSFFVVEAKARAEVRLPTRAVGVIHTSGSTDSPKGVVISEDGLSRVVQSMRDRLANLDVIHYVSILPFSLLLEQVLGIYLPILTNGSVAILPKGVACYTGIQTELGLYFKTVNASHANLSMVPPSFLADLQKLCQSSQSHPRKYLGNDSRVTATGGAPIDISCLEYFREQGVEVFQGYGLSENTSVVAWNYPGPNVLGSVGKPLAHNQVRINGEGQVEVSGDSVFLGYVSKGKFSSRPEGWLSTGDMGYIATDGTLHITGRDNNLIVLSSGRNVSPEWIENKFRSIAGVKDILVVGHGRPFLSALILVEKGCDPESALERTILHSREVADQFPEFAKITAFRTIPLENQYYSVSGRILRSQVLESCAEMIAEIYNKNEIKGALECKTM